MSRVEVNVESVVPRGPAVRSTEAETGNGRADAPHEREAQHGPADQLGRLALMYEDVQRTRLAAAQRGFEDLAAGLNTLEDGVALRLKRELRQHPLWPWLAQYPGLGGVHTATLVAGIRDPHRFPLPGARGDGIRALWHYCGLHVVDGRLAKRQKGVKASWSPRLRRACLMPGGLAEQIVRHRTPVYRAIYDAAKERLTIERGAESRVESDGPAGSGVEAVARLESELRVGLRPIEVEHRARTIAVKAFVGDLLMAWKRLAPKEED